MSNRVIKDSIWTSPTLAKLSNYIQDQWPRWLLMADDWGCFNADPQIIKGLIYPKRNESINKIIQIKNAFKEAGLLFVWSNSEREWGVFVSWNNHQFCNASGVDGNGKYTKHRRKTPIPPQDLFNKYSDKFRQVPTQSLNPNPKPNPNPKEKNTYAEFVKLTSKEHQKLLDKYGTYHLNLMIEKLNNYIGSIGPIKASKKYRSHYHVILGWVKDEILEKYPIGRGHKEFKDDRSPDDKLVGKEKWEELKGEIKKIGKKE